MRLRASFLSIVFLLGMLSMAVSAQTVHDYVVDDAGVFSERVKEQAISYLKELEQDTSVQMVIYVTKTIPDGQTLESYSLQIAETNKIGREGNDNGLLLFLATEDRQYRWEVGYGLEDVLNTPLLGRVSRVYMVPRFQEGNYAQGLLDGTEVVSRILRNSTDEDIMQLKQPVVDQPFPHIEVVFILIVIVIFMLIPIFLRKKLGKGKLSDAHYVGAGWMLFSGGFGRGGGGGFGGGGFSGGGGSFGGGGFSGGF